MELIVKFLVFIYFLGEGLRPYGDKTSTRRSNRIIRKAIIQTLQKLSSSSPRLPPSLPPYCTYEMAGRIMVSYTCKEGFYPFKELDFREELQAMDKSGDNVLDAAELEQVRGIVGLVDQDQNVAFELLAERYPHRNRETWKSLAHAWLKTAVIRFNDIPVPSAEDLHVDKFMTHFEKRFPWAYEKPRVHTPFHDRVLAAAYKQRYYFNVKHEELPAVIHHKFPHLSTVNWNDLLETTSPVWNILVKFEGFYDDSIWRSYYKYLGKEIGDPDADMEIERG